MRERKSSASNTSSTPGSISINSQSELVKEAYGSTQTPTRKTGRSPMRPSYNTNTNTQLGTVYSSPTPTPTLVHTHTDETADTPVGRNLQKDILSRSPILSPTSLSKRKYRSNDTDGSGVKLMNAEHVTPNTHAHDGNEPCERGVSTQEDGQDASAYKHIAFNQNLSHDNTRTEADDAENTDVNTTEQARDAAETTQDETAEGTTRVPTSMRSKQRPVLRRRVSSTSERRKTAVWRDEAYPLSECLEVFDCALPEKHLWPLCYAGAEAIRKALGIPVRERVPTPVSGCDTPPAVGVGSAGKPVAISASVSSVVLKRIAKIEVSPYAISLRGDGSVGLLRAEQIDVLKQEDIDAYIAPERLGESVSDKESDSESDSDGDGNGASVAEKAGDRDGGGYTYVKGEMVPGWGVEDYDKSLVYSLAVTMWYAGNYNLPDDEEADLSKDLNNFLVRMSNDDVEDRPSVLDVIDECERYRNNPAVSDLDYEACVCEMVEDAFKMGTVLKKWVGGGRQESQGDVDSTHPAKDLKIGKWKKILEEVNGGVSLKKCDAPGYRRMSSAPASKFSNVMAEIKLRQPLKKVNERVLAPEVKNLTPMQQLLEDLQSKPSLKKVNEELSSTSLYDMPQASPLPRPTSAGGKNRLSYSATAGTDMRPKSPRSAKLAKVTDIVVNGKMRLSVDLEDDFSDLFATPDIEPKSSLRYTRTMDAGRTRPTKYANQGESARAESYPTVLEGVAAREHANEQAMPSNRKRSSTLSMGFSSMDGMFDPKSPSGVTDTFNFPVTPITMVTKSTPIEDRRGVAASPMSALDSNSIDRPASPSRTIPAAPGAAHIPSNTQSPRKPDQSSNVFVFGVKSSDDKGSVSPTIGLASRSPSPFVFGGSSSGIIAHSPTPDRRLSILSGLGNIASPSAIRPASQQCHEDSDSSLSDYEEDERDRSRPASGNVSIKAINVDTMRAMNKMHSFGAKSAEEFGQQEPQRSTSPFRRPGSASGTARRLSTASNYSRNDSAHGGLTTPVKAASSGTDVTTGSGSRNLTPFSKTELNESTTKFVRTVSGSNIKVDEDLQTPFEFQAARSPKSEVLALKQMSEIMELSGESDSNVIALTEARHIAEVHAKMAMVTLEGERPKVYKEVSLVWSNAMASNSVQKTQLTDA
ncbi:hypothetical protein SARC_01992 [Sphaeroforma arctica JP610]|uniref:KIND domain-containing protein n=1 Tax=Sphaeroforma arctica JP610 TaxID=667725 RepID=A0A0L0GAD7_9EUKA|nr:hypothetical protein SARC_01992 [Sphaeroforma arctica JP610]KNC85846.1 hypothetical protein SARC_01992 [Sphaeroforma arctica JP610]|eukprot:XP_014159748.1 hypothetical protein SARC_01992 [Sphaeroforma arctica JP610]